MRFEIAFWSDAGPIPQVQLYWGDHPDPEEVAAWTDFLTAIAAYPEAQAQLVAHVIELLEHPRGAEDLGDFIRRAAAHPEETALELDL